jgi:hypothetical protein
MSGRFGREEAIEGERLGFERHRRIGRRAFLGVRHRVILGPSAEGITNGRGI